MITRCWEQMHHEDLVEFGICDCQTECHRKSQIVDDLMEALETEDVNIVAFALCADEGYAGVQRGVRTGYGPQG